MTSTDVSKVASSPHRLPTLSASQAIQDLTSVPEKFISTGLKSLDATLRGNRPTTSDENASVGGLMRGHIVEVCGPPGVGKTTFAIQVAASALNSGDSVVWIDTSHELVGSRLSDIVLGPSTLDTKSSIIEPDTRKGDTRFIRFHHFNAPTLSHLMLLLTRPAICFPPPSTSLIVVDSVSTPFMTAFPKSDERLDRNETQEKKRDEASQWASSRKWAVIGDFISALRKLATTKNMAILLTSQSITRIRAEARAMLHPSISAPVWDSAITTRVVLFRDWYYESSKESSQSKPVPGVRFAAVSKATGVSYEGTEAITSFLIEKDGLKEMGTNPYRAKCIQSPGLPIHYKKRKREEVADSESEDEDISSDKELV